MNKHHPHNNIIERKLEQLSAADADHLWNDMHAILDKKMPQKKERRRFIFWFLNGRGLFILTFAVIILTGSSLFLLSTKKSSAITENKVFASTQPDKINDGEIANPPKEKNEPINTVAETSKSGNDKISTPQLLVNNTDDIADHNFIVFKKTIKSKQNTQEGQLTETIQETPKARSDFHIPVFNSKSAFPNLQIVKDHNKEIDSLLRKTEFNNIKQEPRKKNESGFYAGVVSGVDLSSVHFQPGKTGSTTGLIIGYAINKKWSIESGLLWETKRVYDNGSNFKPAGYTPSNGIMITAVNGKSRLYELPVTIKYNITSGKHNLFATTGLSSYFMRSEKYDYVYTQNGQPGGHNYMSYKNGSKDWFSVANFSVGYSHKVGKAGSFRVEPYVKLPIKNIGVGNMPIMSTGLNLGFIKQIK